mgnify:CR=1 FL=1
MANCVYCGDKAVWGCVCSGNVPGKKKPKD